MQNLLKEWLSGFPTVIQYIVILGIIMVLMYICLIVTRKLGERHGDKITFDDPDAYDKTVPDPLARQPLIRRKKKNAEASSEEKKDTED